MMHPATGTHTPSYSALRGRVRFTEEGLGKTVFRIAATDKERAAAGSLVHDVYVRKGYALPCPSGSRVTPFDRLPGTVHFVAEAEGRVTGTIALYPDSERGLPLDCVFKEETDRLRRTDSFIAEVGAFASLSNNQSIAMHLIKIMYLYALDHLGADHLVIAVNPRHRVFYEQVLFFAEMAPCRPYPPANGYPAIALLHDLKRSPDLTYRCYPRDPEENDLHHFLFIKRSASIELPVPGRFSPARG